MAGHQVGHGEVDRWLDETTAAVVAATLQALSTPSRRLMLLALRQSR